MAKRKRPQAKRQDRTRRTPSECLPTSIGERLRGKALAAKMFPDGLRVKNREPAGPHYRELLDYLSALTGTSHERDAWNVYFDWSRPKQEDIPQIESEAAKQGLTYQEFVSREVLKELRRLGVAQK